MPECEAEERRRGIRAELEADRRRQQETKIIQKYLNSPQFKKQYAKLPEDGKNPHKHIRDHKTRAYQCHACVWEGGYQAGQQNPDPKQYAKREELEKMIEKQNPRNIHSQNPSFMKGYAKMKKRALDIIRTFIPHGLEE